jgi:hypothetical protein
MQHSDVGNYPPQVCCIVYIVVAVIVIDTGDRGSPH